jgi:hypothetical protein
MNISKKKKEEFDNIFKLFNINNFYIDINLFRNLFSSDYYEHFLFHIDNKVQELIKKKDIFIIHININSLSLYDIYNYEKIIQMAKLLHKYKNNIPNIIIYESSLLFNNIVYLINLALNDDINKKISFSILKNPNIEENNFYNLNQSTIQ